MVSRIIVLFKTSVHFVEQVFPVAPEHFVRGDIPVIAKLYVIRKNSGMPFNRVKKRCAIRSLRVGKRSVKIEKEAIELHGKNEFLVQGFYFLVCSFWFNVNRRLQQT